MEWLLVGRNNQQGEKTEGAGLAAQRRCGIMPGVWEFSWARGKWYLQLPYESMFIV
jgi:hypothetical protein